MIDITSEETLKEIDRAVLKMKNGKLGAVLILAEIDDGFYALVNGKPYTLACMLCTAFWDNHPEVIDMAKMLLPGMIAQNGTEN